MIKVGITGGIGSGKTTVCSFFEQLGIPIYNADKEAKNLMVTNTKLKSGIIKLLGADSYKNAVLNREYISSRVFHDKALLGKLNSLVHPVVKKYFVKWANQHNSPYVIYEAALMIESGSYKLMDKLIVVTAPHELRIDRVSQRDSVDRGKVIERIRNQMSQEEMIRYADHVIINDGKISLIRQVMELHYKFTQIV